MGCSTLGVSLLVGAGRAIARLAEVIIDCLRGSVTTVVVVVVVVLPIRARSIRAMIPAYR